MGSDSKENYKRAREDNSESDSPEPKLARADLPETVRNNQNVHSGVTSPQVERIQDDLLDILDDSDELPIQGLDSLMKSFEQEILVPVTGAEAADVSAVTPAGTGSQPDLGYLFEASDDELGLPPKSSNVEEKISNADFVAEAETETETSGSGSGGFGEILGFENELPSHDSFEFGLGCDSVSSGYNDSGDFVALGGLFDYSDEAYVPAEKSDVTWQPESLPAS